MPASKDDVARIIVRECQHRGYNRDECLAIMSALWQESGWRDDVWDPTHTTYGIAQQDGSYPKRFDGAEAQVTAFFDRLDRKRGGVDIWLLICWLQQAPNWPSAQFWWDHGRRDYLTEIKSRIVNVTPYLDKFFKYSPATGGPSVPDNRPAFNEFPIWSDNFSDRGGKKPSLFLLHTQEGGGGNAAAENLANWFKSANQVSYHYTISQAADGGVTVVDCVDTDLASWSVLDANSYSINLCFAGSKAAWTRDDWLKQANAIDVAAYLAVQDAKKYGFPATLIGTGGAYNNAKAGVADHQFVTNVLKIGTHTDVGPGFPKDVFNVALAKYANAAAQPPAPSPSADVLASLKAVRAELDSIIAKLGG